MIFNFGLPNAKNNGVSKGNRFKLPGGLTKERAMPQDALVVNHYMEIECYLALMLNKHNISLVQCALLGRFRELLTANALITNTIT